MARFLATHNISGLTEAEFRDKLGAYTGGVSKWRPDRRTTILKVYADTVQRQALHRVRGRGAVAFRGLDEDGRLARRGGPPD